jgi:hypothetical protein
MAKVGNIKGKAVIVVESALRAWGIEYRMPRSPQEADLVVKGKRVAVGGSADADIVLDPVAVLASDLETVKAELHRLTEYLGLGKLGGFRNVTGLERAKSEDYEATSMRLTPFGRTLNPTEADIKKWAYYVKRESDRAAYRYTGLLNAMAMSKEDLYSIGLVYLCTFLSRHRSGKNEKADAAYLTHFLQQEFRRWATVTTAKLKNIAPATAGLPVDLVVGAPCGNATFGEESSEAAYTFDIEVPEGETVLEPVFNTVEDAERYERKRQMQEGRYKAQRQRNALMALEDGLASLSHDRFVEALSEVICSGQNGNPDVFDVDAKEEAQRRFDAHMEECPACRCAHQAWTEREQEARARIGAKRGRKPGRRTAVRVSVDISVANEPMADEEGGEVFEFAAGDDA